MHCGGAGSVVVRAACTGRLRGGETCLELEEFPGECVDAGEGPGGCRVLWRRHWWLLLLGVEVGIGPGVVDLRAHGESQSEVLEVARGGRLASMALMSSSRG